MPDLDKSLHPAEGPGQAGHDERYGNRQAGHDADRKVMIGFLAVQHDWIPLWLTTGASIGVAIAMRNSNSCYSLFGLSA